MNAAQSRNKLKTELGQPLLALSIPSSSVSITHSNGSVNSWLTRHTELRSPVASHNTRGGSSCSFTAITWSSTEYRESQAIRLDKASRLSSIVNDLFTLARADAGQYPLRARDFYHR